MAAKFLDDTGLGHLWERITSHFVKKAGDTMTGPLTVQGDITAGYLQGTWLQSSAASELTNIDKVCVYDGSGWVYWISVGHLKEKIVVPATDTVWGAIKAPPKTNKQTQGIGIGLDGMLYTEPGAGSTAADIFVMVPVSWAGSELPYTQTVSVPGMTASKSIEIGLQQTATAAEYDAARRGRLLAIGQGTDTITLASFGVPPEIPLPILIKEKPVAAVGIDTVITLPPVNWAGDAVPYTQTVAVSGLQGTELVGLAENITADQYVAAANGSLFAVASVGTLTVKAMNEKPTVAIPLRIKAV